MSKTESILIVTDNAPSSREAALAIVAELFSKKLSIVKGSEFSGTDILGADFCFFCCARPNPADFVHFEKVLRHINLSLRRCALFSTESKDAAAYLAGLIMDSGIKIEGEIFVSSSLTELRKWAANIINKN